MSVESERGIITAADARKWTSNVAPKPGVTLLSTAVGTCPVPVTNKKHVG